MINNIESLREEINSLDMRIASSPQYDDIELYDQYAALGVSVSLLANAIRFSGLGNYEDAKMCMAQAAQYGFQMESKNFDALYNACDLFLVWNNSIIRNKTKYERYYQNLFKKHAHDICEDWEIVQKKVDQHHIPDAWVKYGEAEFPVEVKRREFDKAALRQLTRYMDFYKSPCGIAVGMELTVDLPENITFISLSALEALENQDVNEK